MDSQALIRTALIVCRMGAELAAAKTGSDTGAKRRHQFLSASLPCLFDSNQRSRHTHLIICVFMATSSSPDFVTGEFLSSNGADRSSAVCQ